MPRLFDARQEAFCNFYVRGPYAGMVCDAYEAAGYARDSGNASRLLRQHEIGRRIAELRAGEAALARQAELAAFEQLKIDKIRIAQELAKVGFADLSDYVGDGGALDFKRLAQASGPAVRDLNIACLVTPEGEQKILKLHLRLQDKSKALIELARMHDAIHAPTINGVDERPVHTAEGERDWVLARLRDWAEEGRDVWGLASEAVAAANKPFWERQGNQDRMAERLAGGAPIVSDPTLADEMYRDDGLDGLDLADDDKDDDEPTDANLVPRDDAGTPDEPRRAATASRAPARAAKPAPKASKTARTASPKRRRKAAARKSKRKPASVQLTAGDDGKTRSVPGLSPALQTTPPAEAPLCDAMAGDLAPAGVDAAVAEPVRLALDGLPMSVHGMPGACPVCRSRSCNAGHSPAEYAAAGLPYP
jgi:hypothetical protein